jgi:hypothetical protein
MRALCLAAILGTGLLTAFVAAAPAVAAGSETAEAANARLADFSGPWVGSTGTNAEIVRNATLLIEPKGSGFTMTWTNFEADQPDAPSTKVTARARSMSFEASKRAGLWRATGTGDPVLNHAGWAYIKGRTLIVSTIAVLPDGRLEQQIYDRTLTDKGLTLAYRRLLDGQTAKTIEAEFLKLNPVTK